MKWDKSVHSVQTLGSPLATWHYVTLRTLRRAKSLLPVGVGASGSRPQTLALKLRGWPDYRWPG